MLDSWCAHGKDPSVPAGRNVVLKSATTERDGMSNDSEATAADDEEAGEETANDEVTGLQEGDFIKLAYTARTVEDGDLVDTTSEEVAESEDVDTEGQEFAPRTIVLGQGHIFESVEDDIVGAAVGEEGSVVVPAAEAFGEYDDEEVRTISKDKIPEDDRYPGAQVQIEQQQGFIETIIGGRARVDFNHPLAGEDIEYEYEVIEEVEDREAKAQGVISMMLDMELDVWFQTDTVEEEQIVEDDEESEAEEAEEDEESEPEFETVEVEKETLYIEATPQLSMNQQWMMGKQQIAQQLTDLLDIDRIIVQEELGGGMGMGGMMGGMGGMGGGDVDLEEALEDADIDADELAEDLEE
jgi:FKBP-type peptidyl-prolyl cis-trans isomerase SlyD